MKYNILLIILVLILSSCSSPKKNRGMITSSLFKPKRNPELKSLIFNGKISANFKEINQAAKCKLYMSDVDSVSLSLYGPFNVLVGKLFAKKDYFRFFNVFANEVMHGEPSPENMKVAIFMPLSYYDFIRLGRNETPGDPDKFVYQKMIPQKHAILYKNTENEDFVEYALYSILDSTLIQYQRKNPDNELTLNVFFEGHEYFDGYKLPKNITFQFPLIDGKLTIEVDEVVVNHEFTEPFIFDIPKKVKLFKL